MRTRTTRCLALIVLILGGALKVVSGAEDSEIERYLKTFTDLHLARDTDAMADWVRSEEGKKALELFTARYEALDPSVRETLSMELARLGLPEVVPIVAASFDKAGDAQIHALAGISYALFYGRAETDYKMRLAPLVAGCLESKNERNREYAIDLLPKLDRERAESLLLKAEFLDREAKNRAWVFRAFVAADALLPLALIEETLKQTREKAMQADGEAHDRWCYEYAVVALAKHDYERAVALLDEYREDGTRDLWKISDVFMAGKGLRGLYEAIAATPDEAFARLPEPARVFFAVRYFEGDVLNGGYDQAFSNSTGDYIADVRLGYKAIGAMHSSTLVEAICALFGENGPSPDRRTRQRQLDDMAFDLEEKIDSLPEWKEVLAAPREDIRYLTARYAAMHAEELRPLIRR